MHYILIKDLDSQASVLLLIAVLCAVCVTIVSVATGLYFHLEQKRLRAMRDEQLRDKVPPQ